jgi:insecticidal toxin complex protein TccC
MVAGRLCATLSFIAIQTCLPPPSVRLTRHHYNARGLVQSADPRLHDAGLVNVVWLRDLNGNMLRTQSTDAGTTVMLKDAFGRPLLVVDYIGTEGNGTTHLTQAVTRTFAYEGYDLPGRLLSVSEQRAADAIHCTERLVCASQPENAGSGCCW